MKTLLSSIVLFMLTVSLFAQSASESYEQALSNYNEGDYDLAIDQVSKAIDLNKTGDYYKLRADCFQKMGEFSSALADYDFAEKKGCLALDFFINRGICRTSLGLYDAAKKDLRRHLEAFPGDAVAHYYLGAISYMNMDNDRSLTYLNQAITMNDEYMPAYFLRGANYYELGKYSKAEADFRMAVELDPSEPQAAINLGRILLIQMKPDEAIEILSALKTADSLVQADIDYFLAEAYFTSHDKEKACEHWLAAAELGDDDGFKNHQNLCIKKNGKHRTKRSSFMEF